MNRRNLLGLIGFLFIPLQSFGMKKRVDPFPNYRKHKGTATVTVPRRCSSFPDSVIELATLEVWHVFKRDAAYKLGVPTPDERYLGTYCPEKDFFSGMTSYLSPSDLVELGEYVEREKST